MSRRRITLLDWTQASITDREYDLGWMSVQHLSRMPLPVADPLYDWLWLPVRPFTWILMAPTRWIYRAIAGYDAERVRYYAAFCALRSLVTCAKLRDAADGAHLAELQAWGSPHTTWLLRRRLRAISGIDPATARPAPQLPG